MADHLSDVVKAANKQVEQVDPNQDQIRQEIVMVADAYALIDPLAMVVVPVDTDVADEAMSRLSWAQHLTSRADVHRPEVLVQFQERYLRRSEHSTRVLVCRNNIRNELKNEKNRQWIHKCTGADEWKDEEGEQGEGDGQHRDVEDHRRFGPFQLHQRLFDVEARYVNWLDPKHVVQLPPEILADGNVATSLLLLAFVPKNVEGRLAFFVHCESIGSFVYQFFDEL